MTQQAAAGQGAPAAGRAGRAGRFYRGRGDPPTKGYKSSAISKIANETFNMGQNRFAAQFTQSRKNVANYLQRTAANEGYLVVETVRTGKEQIIALPPAVNTSAAGADDQKIIREETMRAIAKRKVKLDNALKKGFATVYDQCSLEVRDKLEASNEWDRVQREQLLHDLISKIKRICVGFDDHKQDVFNLVKALKTLFLYTQTEKGSVDKYACNYKSLWDVVEAFSGSPGIQQGLMKELLTSPGRVRNPNNITNAERTGAEEEVAGAVKAALLISGADKWRCGRLKEQLANNYLLGTDQYLDMLEKASRILGNYQVAKGSPFGDQRNTNKGGGAHIHTVGSPCRTRLRRTGSSDRGKRRRRHHRGRRSCSKRE